MVHVETNIIQKVMRKEIPILNKYVNDFASNKIYLGIYTFVTRSLLLVIKRTLPWSPFY